MKKVLALLIASLLCFSLFSCNEGSTDGTEDRNESEGKSENEGDTPFWLEDGELCVLCIGNSFTIDSMQFFPELARSCGVKKLKAVVLYIGSSELSQHYALAKSGGKSYEYRVSTGSGWSVDDEKVALGQVINEEKWDFVTIQQSSAASGIERSYSNLDQMASYVKEKAPNARLFWNMTWAYQNDFSGGNQQAMTFQSAYGKDQMKMYGMITSAVKNTVMKNGKIDGLIPTGTAIQNARSSYVGDTLTRDGFHLSYDLGRYIASLTSLKAMLGLDITGKLYSAAGVDKNEKQVAIESVTNAIKDPLKVTKSQYKDKP